MSTYLIKYRFSIELSGDIVQTLYPPDKIKKGIIQFNITLKYLNNWNKWYVIPKNNTLIILYTKNL